ncbi:nuclear transport factor 2 family protein [Actinomadura rupiterrae]|uniref:nuclear transport factor 2 family protein n=1 Tax=Actinomadura rupiterrae TaxID=559627 RepID=UPI0020A318AA|nr:nuclear transport factor 2 family protein [Actinomadura rupiterrae]MCP2341235.1 ketosteroid isomerase-like protein [Actinomadura rupiterrae]
MPDGPREVLARYQQASIDKALDAMVDLYAEDAVHEFPFTRPGIPSEMRGREAIRAFLEANWRDSPLRYESYRDVTIHETADPEVIIVERKAVGSSTATGRDFALPNIVVLRVRDGRIVHFRDYVNVLAASEALGLTQPR